MPRAPRSPRCAYTSKPPSTFPKRRSISSAAGAARTARGCAAAHGECPHGGGAGRKAYAWTDHRHRRPAQCRQEHADEPACGPRRRDRATVAGTTQDLLRAQLEIDGVPVELIDTAASRNATGDPIEAEGMRRAREAIARADHVLFLGGCDRRSGVCCPMKKSRAHFLQMSRSPSCATRWISPRRAGTRFVETPALAISATTGEGVDALRQRTLPRWFPPRKPPVAHSPRARANVDALRRAALHRKPRNNNSPRSRASSRRSNCARPSVNWVK